MMIRDNERLVQFGDGALFPGFFLGGFECSTLVNSRGVRIDELKWTGHDRRAAEDYALLRERGIRTVRDGIRWNLVDRNGRLDFSEADTLIAAAAAERMTVVWDLFHFGYPDDLDPFEDEFCDRFCRYGRQFARLLIRKCHGEKGDTFGVRYYTPINEISFFAWAGGEAGWFAPY